MLTEAMARNRAEGPRRGSESRRRQAALRAALSGAPVPADMPAGDLAAAAARQASRQALALARAEFDSAVGENAAALAEKLVALGMQGNPAVLLSIARTLQPPAKWDSTKVSLDIGPLESPDDLDRARRRVAQATFAGEIGLEDSAHLTKLLDSLSEQQARDQRAALVDDMRAAIADSRSGGLGLKLSAMTAQATLLLQGLATSPAPMIEAEPDDGEDWRCLL